MSQAPPRPWERAGGSKGGSWAAQGGMGSVRGLLFPEGLHRLPPSEDADLGTPGATPATCAAQDLPSPGQEITAPCVYSKSPHHMQGHESGHLSKLSCFIRGCLGWGRCGCVAIEVAGGPHGGGTGGGAGSYSCGEPLSVSWLACSVPQSQTTQDVAGLMRGVPRPPCALKLYIKAQLYENKRFFRLKLFD